MAAPRGKLAITQSSKLPPKRVTHDREFELVSDLLRQIAQSTAHDAPASTTLASLARCSSFKIDARPEPFGRTRSSVHRRPSLWQAAQIIQVVQFILRHITQDIDHVPAGPICGKEPDLLRRAGRALSSYDEFIVRPLPDQGFDDFHRIMVDCERAADRLSALEAIAIRIKSGL